MKHRIQNSEYGIQKAGNAQSRDDATVVTGRAGYAADFPSANLRCRYATRPDQDADPGESGAKPGGNEADGVKTARFRPLKPAENRLGPPSPAFAHLDFINKEAMNAGNDVEQKETERDTHGGGPPSRGALCEKFIGFYRVVSRFIGYYRTEQARIIAFSRILSIGAFFDKEARN